ncbi:golgin subfamily B member 1-like isoform X1 [Chlorella sorokiniana]|uniref:Golgin subfamily B member 1-like isoform X1 n=1 Tax=Chlorella sorokiniana TaxID=3076 RepID=A0A2P6TYL7_CHLSO|nr:golgin subfamily B member 1-like isoform X1 [Chlorella sorokiniana]|eukprot:PRW59157.1 golgin subfamily B member 1-like isoform X1 [Chlorella sorokiniana]
MLKYDPDSDNGFAEHEMRAVTFLDDHVLYDNVEGEDACDLLHWRREGEAWEPPADDEAEEGAEAAPLSLGDIVQQISAAERLRGRTVEEDTAEALAELPAEKRLRIAAGFRDFSEHISAELNKLSEQHGADYVVTEADIKAATAAAMAAALGGGR